MTDQGLATDDEPRVCASCRNRVTSPRHPRHVLAFCDRELCRQRSLVWDRILAHSLPEPSALEPTGTRCEIVFLNLPTSSPDRIRTTELVIASRTLETELARISRLIQEHGSADLSRLTDSRGKLLKQRRQHEHELATLMRRWSGTSTGRIARDFHHWRDWRRRRREASLDQTCPVTIPPQDKSCMIL